MKRILIVLLLVCAGNSQADFYGHIGLYYNNSPAGWVYLETDNEGNILFEERLNASHAIFEFVGGYQFDKIPIGVEIKHRSDPLKSGREDLVSEENVGIVFRF